MSLPKRFTTGNRYLGSSAFNSFVDFIDPNQGQASDGTPNAAVTVVRHVPANISPGSGIRGAKEVDKPQERIGQSLYKIIVHFPQNYTLDTGMQIQLNSQIMQVESFYDPDGQQVELHIFAWQDNATAGASE